MKVVFLRGELHNGNAKRDGQCGSKVQKVQMASDWRWRFFVGHDRRLRPAAYS
jgi:hypothetical protein